MTDEPKPAKRTAKKAATVANPSGPPLLGSPRRKRASELRPGDAIWVLKHVTEVSVLADDQVRVLYDDGSSATLPATSSLPVP
jgi:hypothetical protein